MLAPKKFVVVCKETETDSRVELVCSEAVIVVTLGIAVLTAEVRADGITSVG